MSKEKGCEMLSEWIKPCENHLYWSASTTFSGNGLVIWAKFKTFLSHIINKHTSLSDPLFNKCGHGDIHPRKWLHAGMYWKGVNFIHCNPWSILVKNTRASELTKSGVPDGLEVSPSWISLSGWTKCLPYFLSKIYLADEVPVHQAGIIQCTVAQMQGNLLISSDWMATFSSVEFMSS